MRGRLTVGLAASLGALCLLGTGTAAAATEFGDTCEADQPVPTPLTLMTLSAPGGSIPLAAPIKGVMTQIKMQIKVPLPVRFPELVKLVRPAGGNKYTVVDQATMEVGGGSTVAPVRMQVEPGDRLAVRGLPFVFGETPAEGYEFYCTSPEAALGEGVADVPLGGTTEFAEVAKGRMPLSATIEPDADHDGYGDETQDKCPQSALTAAPCPAIALESVALPGRGRATVYVTSSTETPVGVTGTVKLGKGKTATLSGGIQAVAPGKLVPFTLKFSKALSKKLRELPKTKKLILKLTASATNVIGQVSADTTTVVLRGLG